MRTDLLPQMALERPGSKLQALRGPNTEAREQVEKARIREAALEFEGLLLEQMVQAMRKNVPKSDLFGEGRAKEIFQEMLDGEYVKQITQQGGIGLAELMVRQMETLEGKK